ncbi:MAG: flagellar hook-length control protein FliK [Phenylobacterium sp.]|uniref:flagellar hook-length control protein FliK n=1 Tax=Phenylobacterium sp. TaxID=1871053 RepID=UPI003918C7DE
MITVPVEAIRPAGAIVRPVEPTPTSAASQNNVQPEARRLAQQAQTAAARQGALAPLIADLAKALDIPGLPAGVRAAATRLLAQAGPLSANVTGADIAKAFAQSGLFLEARLAAEPRRSPVGRDLKAGLLTLKGALDGFLATQPQAQTSRAPGPPPPPPHRDGATSAQPSARASLPADATPVQVVQRLAGEAEGALARAQLHQLASLPQAGAEEGGARWMFEVPFTTPGGAAVAQFEIQRDGGGEAASGDRPPVWRAGFSIDLDSLGPVHAKATLLGDEVGVHLWGERPEAAERLKALQPELAMALARARLRPEVAVHLGAPPRRSPGAGQFVDQVS